MAEESDLERTEPASSRRIEQAREEGQVPQSRELTAFLVLLSGTAGLWALSGFLSHHAEALLRTGLSFGRDAAFAQDAMQLRMASLSMDGLLIAGPICFMTVVAALVAPFLIGGWVFSTKALALNFTRLDPVGGIRRIVSMHGLGELVKAVMKALLIGGTVFWVIWHHGEAMFSLMGNSVEVGIQGFFRMLFVAAVALLTGMAVITLIDVPFQLWQYYSKLRMTREELRQEMKEMEGDPHLKARIRSQQREMARQRMMSEVPKADVVVTNPTHFAVALKYDTTAMEAPQIVAKGMNFVAQRIRELADEHHVPIIEAPPLARALYRHAEIGDQIPAPLYTAVAEVMAYVYQLNRFIADGGANLLPPSLPVALAVPADMDPGVPEA